MTPNGSASVDVEHPLPALPTLTPPDPDDPAAPRIDRFLRLLADPDVHPWHKARARWRLSTDHHPSRNKRRPHQLAPPGDDWDIAYWQAGRGYGKTRIGAEDVSDYLATHPGAHYGGMFATFADGRDVAVEGTSGILRCVPPSAVSSWNRSQGHLIFTNGSEFKMFTSEKPDGPRGWEFDRAWLDEPGKFRYLGPSYSNMMLTLRRGEHPQTLITGTPRPLGLLRDLMSRNGDDVRVVRGSSMENRHNLAPTTIAMWERLAPPGSQLWRQEILGEMLDDYPGALWNRALIDRDRWVGKLVPPLRKVCIGIDPSGYSPELDLDATTGAALGALGGHGRETGVVVVGMDYADPPHVYVLADYSGKWRAEEWAFIALWEAYTWERAGVECLLVPERNLNAPAVLATIRLADRQGGARFYMDGGKPGVWAAVGKRARAERIHPIYEVGRAHHAGNFPELEDAMCTWDPNENWSPDRIDALVWAATALEPWGLIAPSGDSLGAFEEALGGAYRY